MWSFELYQCENAADQWSEKKSREFMQCGGVTWLEFSQRMEASSHGGGSVFQDQMDGSDIPTELHTKGDHLHVLAFLN